MVLSNRERGLYEKFLIERTDGRSDLGEKHYGCKYFVLDLTHDQHAIPALNAYAESCATEYPALAADLLRKKGEMIQRREQKTAEAVHLKGGGRPRGSPRCCGSRYA